MAKKSFLNTVDLDDDNELPTIIDQTEKQIPSRNKGRGPVEGFLSVEDALQLLPVCERTLKSYLRSGKIRASKFGGKWRITEKAIEDFKLGKDPSEA